MSVSSGGIIPQERALKKQILTPSGKGDNIIKFFAGRRPNTLKMKRLENNSRRLLERIPLFKKAKVLVIGDFILDRFVWGKVERISPEAPVPVVHVQRESYMPGGSLNVAHNIHTLGGTVIPCGIVGRDWEGRMLLKILRRQAIDSGGIVYEKDRPTTLKTRVIAHSQQVVRFDREKIQAVSEEARRKILKFIRQKMAGVDAVVIEDYGKGMIEPVLVKEILRLAKKFTKPILVDPKEKHFSYYRGVTAITPNRKEAYSGFASYAPRSAEANGRERSLEEVGRGLLRHLKCEAVLITLGEGGMALFEKDGSVTKIPTAAREVYDVSGAGDTVIAVFALALAAGAKKREAAMLSNLAAGVVVAKLGTATVTPEELKASLLNAGAGLSATQTADPSRHRGGTSRLYGRASSGGKPAPAVFEK